MCFDLRTLSALLPLFVATACSGNDGLVDAAPTPADSGLDATRDSRTGIADSAVDTTDATDTSLDTCGPPDCPCPTGLVACGGACIATDSDPDNCGFCEYLCGAAQVCNMGRCECPDGAREVDCDNGVDDDCDGIVDCEDPDCSDATRPCGEEPCVGTQACDGAGTWSRCVRVPVGPEICGDGIDQDCDGSDLRMPDAFEPNDTCEACALISSDTDPNVTMAGRFDSVDDAADCYRFEAEDSTDDESITIRLTTIPSGHDYDVFLYDSLIGCRIRAAIARSTNTGSSDERIVWSERITEDDSGTYYVRVVSFMGHTCTDDYSLSVDGLN